MKIVSLMRKVVRFEWDLWKSLGRWVFRRPVLTEPGGQAFSYAGAVTPLLIGITIVSLIEIPTAHLFLPWPTARVILFLLGVQAVFWIVGLLASLRVNPHVVSDSGLRVRYGTEVDFTIAWHDIETVRTRLRSMSKNKTVLHEDAALHVGVAGQTNLDVVLRQPVIVRLRDETSEPFSQLCFYADNAAGLATCARERLSAHCSEPDGTAPAAISG